MLQSDESSPPAGGGRSTLSLPSDQRSHPLSLCQRVDGPRRSVPLPGLQTYVLHVFAARLHTDTKMRFIFCFLLQVESTDEP